MSNTLPTIVCAVVMAACSQPDVVTSRTMSAPTGPVFAVSPKLQSVGPSNQAPDVEAALAAEAAALDQIKAYVPADVWPKMLAKLERRPQLENGEVLQIHMISATSDAHLSQLLARYYEARFHTDNERRRQDAVNTARRRGAIPVVVALGEPRDGALAEVIRRLDTDPWDVIVLAAGATPEVLGAALETLERSRARDGDMLQLHMTIQDVKTVSVDAAKQAQLTKQMEELRNAEPRLIKGVGTVKSIIVRSSPRAS